MKILRRYTDALSLLDMIKHERLTLTSPDTWFDQNDTFGLREYAKRMGGGSSYALCMTEQEETGHHWQMFAGTSHGVCVQFGRDEFIEFLDGKDQDLIHGSVQYLNLTQVRDLKPIPDGVLPFLKRETFKSENEYRLVAFEEEVFAGETYRIKMPVSLIKRVTFGPRMPKQLAQTLKDVACGVGGCGEIEWAISRVHNNESWRKAVIAGLSE